MCGCFNCLITKLNTCARKFDLIIQQPLLLVIKLKGFPVDIEMSIEIIGVDPKYPLQHSYDKTFETKAFESLSRGNDVLGQMLVEREFTENGFSLKKGYNSIVYYYSLIICCICIVTFCPVAMYTLQWILIDTKNQRNRQCEKQQDYLPSG
uniref:Uncharacterized protein n=1 Tax=Onchocerca volvulus TaxID=6282 RepID=A0A8R1Y1N9_ONCVO